MDHESDETPASSDGLQYGNRTFSDGQVESMYRIALADYRLERGHILQPVLAMIVESSTFLVNPAGVQFCGEDAQCAGEYDRMNARIWFRLCATALDADDHFLKANVVRTVVVEEFEGAFDVAVPDPEVDHQFWDVITTEFGDEPTVSTEVAEDVALWVRLICTRLCQIEKFTG
jgi:hypothetical protein